MTKTAIEWLEDQIKNSKYFYKLMEDINSRSTVAQSDIFEQAKEIEKYQIMDAAKIMLFNSTGTGNQIDRTYGRAEQYYNETFNKKA
jgi:hypothetical protein